jgi:dsRNA-specific ribonuclease
MHYSKFPEMTDPEFHKLRKAYIAAADALEAFIGQVEEAEEEE